MLSSLECIQSKFCLVQKAIFSGQKKVKQVVLFHHLTKGSNSHIHFFFHHSPSIQTNGQSSQWMNNNTKFTAQLTSFSIGIAEKNVGKKAIWLNNWRLDKHLNGTFLFINLYLLKWLLRFSSHSLFFSLSLQLKQIEN